MARLHPGNMPGWPRLLTRELAVAYTSLTLSALDSIPVKPIEVSGRKLWDRHKLDEWANKISCRSSEEKHETDWVEVLRARKDPAQKRSQGNLAG